MIGMSKKRGGPQLFAQRFYRFVFTALEFIAHHGHLWAAVFFAQREVSHALGFDFDEQRQGIGRDGGIVIGAVHPSGCIGLRADAFENLVVTGAETAVVFSAAFKHQVLQQMRRTRSAGDFVAGADMISHHECGHRRGLYWEQQNLQAVRIQFVFCDAAHGADISEVLDLGGGVIAPSEGGGKGERYGNEAFYHADLNGIGRRFATADRKNDILDCGSPAAALNSQPAGVD